MDLLPKHLLDIHHFSPHTCAKLHQDIFKTHAWSAQSFEALLKLPTVFGKGVRNFPHGCLGFYLAQQADDTGELLTLLIHPTQQRQGYGQVLLKNFLETARERKIKHLFLEVSEHNQIALSLYQKAGFQQIGKRPFYYSQIDRMGESALTFRLSF